MKNVIFFLLLITAFFLSPSCTKDPVEPQPEWVKYCENVSGGNLDLKIDGKDWKSGCVQSVYTESIDSSFSQKTLWVYAYNYGATFLDNSEVELFYLLYSEITANGNTEISSTAVFVDGFYNLIANPNAVFEGKSYASNESLTDNINITQLTSSLAKGTLNFTLFNEEDSTEDITITGSFSANIEN